MKAANLQIAIKQTLVGGNAPIVVQTMTNTSTTDIEASVKQCISMAKAGAQIIRLTTQGEKEVEALAKIKNTLAENGIFTPLVADVHFSSKVAIEAAKVADKVRINPGNFAKEHSVAISEFRKLIDVCKKNNTVLRIGLNHGSLGERIINLYGNTPLAMKEAAMEWIRMCINNNFYNIILSLKASNTMVMVSAYRLLKEEFEHIGINFPLHLGITESGNGDMGRIKSAVGIGTLLNEGIGNTIRVSLTEDPINEVAVGKIIADYYTIDRSTNKSEAMLHNSVINEQINNKTIPYYSYDCQTWDEFIIKASCDFGHFLLDNIIDDFKIDAKCGGELVLQSKIEEFKDNLLQAARRKFTKPEYIACPGCGRTQYDLERTFNEVKRRTSHLKGLRIAVMGCIVNGPGEMADADYGYVGEGPGKVAIYKGKEVLLRQIPQDEAIDALLNIIENDLAI